MAQEVHAEQPVEARIVEFADHADLDVIDRDAIERELLEPDDRRLHAAAGVAAYEPPKPKKPHIKKPLNAFMLFMKEMRAKVVAECTLKESAAINQILGRKVRRRAGRANLALQSTPDLL